MTIASFRIEEGLQQETVLLPPALDLSVEGGVVGQGPAPGRFLGGTLGTGMSLDVIHGFSDRASAKVFPDDGAVAPDTAIQVALGATLMPVHVYYLLRSAPPGPDVRLQYVSL